MFTAPLCFANFRLTLHRTDDGKLGAHVDLVCCYWASYDCASRSATASDSSCAFGGATCSDHGTVASTRAWISLRALADASSACITVCLAMDIASTSNLTARIRRLDSRRCWFAQ